MTKEEALKRHVKWHVKWAREQLNSCFGRGVNLSSAKYKKNSGLKN